MAVATKPAVLYNLFLFMVIPGTGEKLTCYTQFVMKLRKIIQNINIVYIKGDEFTNELIEAIRRGYYSRISSKI